MPSAALDGGLAADCTDNPPRLGGCEEEAAFEIAEAEEAALEADGAEAWAIDALQFANIPRSSSRLARSTRRTSFFLAFSAAFAVAASADDSELC